MRSRLNGVYSRAASIFYYQPVTAAIIRGRRLFEEMWYPMELILTKVQLSRVSYFVYVLFTELLDA